MSKEKSPVTKSKNQKAQKKRRSRSKFRPTFKERAIFSFSKSLCAMGEIREIIQDESSEHQQIGIQLMTCYTELSHSIEMLCKATLLQRSPYLILEKLAPFDTAFPDEKSLAENTCGAKVALARASKLFRKKFTNEHLGKLLKVIESRNKIIHSDYFIKEFTQEIHFLVSAFSIVVDVYDNQFREADLIREAQSISQQDISQIYKRSIQEISADFKKLEVKIKKLKNEGVQFIRCLNCYYPFAKLDSKHNNYNCLWCGDTKHKKICSLKTCNKEFWIEEGSERTTCGSIFHLPEAFSDMINSSTTVRTNDFANGSLVNTTFWEELLKSNFDSQASLDLTSSSDFMNRAANPQSLDKDEENDPSKKNEKKK